MECIAHSGDAIGRDVLGKRSRKKLRVAMKFRNLAHKMKPMHVRVCVCVCVCVFVGCGCGCGNGENCACMDVFLGM